MRVFDKSIINTCLKIFTQFFIYFSITSQKHSAFGTHVLEFELSFARHKKHHSGNAVTEIGWQHVRLKLAVRKV